MKTTQEKIDLLSKISAECYAKWGTESYGVRCELFDLIKQLEKELNTPTTDTPELLTV